MLEFREITIGDKALFDKYLRSKNPEASELTFTNFFMWRNFYKFRYTEIAGLLCIIAAPEGGKPYGFFPIGDITSENFYLAMNSLKEYFKALDMQLEFRRVTERDAGYFKERFPDAELLTELDRSNSDYLYLTENLIYLKGKKFDGKRNHINKFRKLYEYEYVVLNGSYKEECYKIMDRWCAERDCDEHKGFYCEKLANAELIENFTELGCKGALIKVNGSFEAFTIGEMLNDDTAVIHLEKADSKIVGLYTFINQQFCEYEWKETKYINREQDLGMDGLRKAKLSYNPACLVNKYSIIVKQ